MSSTVETLVIGVSGGAPDDEVRTRCRHHWIIATPNGSSSLGVCKFCKEEKEFNNSVDRYFIKKSRAQQARLSPGTR